MYLTINSPLSWEEHSYFTYFLQHSLLGMKWYNLVRKSLWNCYWQMICLKHFSQNQNYVAMIAQMASIISLHTSQNPTEPWWHYMGGGCARIVKMFLQGVSWGGHAEFRLYFFFSFFLLLSTLVERRCCRIQATLLQNKERCQSKSCQKLYFGTARVRASSVNQHFPLRRWWFSFHCGVVVRARSRFNERSSSN